LPGQWPVNRRAQDGQSRGALKVMLNTCDPVSCNPDKDGSGRPPDNSLSCKSMANLYRDRDGRRNLRAVAGDFP
jgi:hypothetical protein